MRDTRIDDMKPGPELDDLAEEIIFRRTTKEFDDIYTNRWRFKRRDDEKFPNHWHQSQPYSTTWIGFGFVVEEMQRRNYFVAIQGSGREWSVMFCGGPTRLCFDADGVSAPHATVLAAIKALQGEDRT